MEWLNERGNISIRFDENEFWKQTDLECGK